MGGHVALSQYIKEKMNNQTASAIRAMFNEGVRLKQQYGTDNVFDFSLGNPDLEPPQSINSIIHNLAEEPLKGRHAYMNNAGYEATRGIIAQKVGKEQHAETTLCAEHVVMTCGAAGALNVVFKALLNKNDLVLVSAPFFTEYTYYVENHGGILESIPATDTFSFNIPLFKKTFDTAIQKKQTIAAILLNSPHNPTGKIYSESELNELILLLNDYAKCTGVYPFLIVDEPYRAITYDNKKTPAVFTRYANTIIVSSFAKDLSLPGERIGYVVVNPACSEALQVIQACSFTNRILGFVNAPAFFQRVIEKLGTIITDCSLYEKKRNLLCAILDDCKIPYFKPEGAFYIFCKVPFNSITDYEFCTYLKKYNILAVPGSGFGGAGWFRLAFCVSENTITNSHAAFKKAMEEFN